MEYFIMRPDQRILNPVELDFNQQEFDQNEPFVIKGEYTEKTKKSDYILGKRLFKYYFCVSDALKELIEIYATELQATPFFITDTKEEKQITYWKIQVPEEDCLVKKSFMKSDQLTLAHNPKHNLYIFKVCFEKQEHLAVSLHLAENILRKGFYGIQFVPIQPK